MRASSFIDGWPARALALLVFVGCAGTLAWLHRADLFPAEETDARADDPFRQCLAERRAEVENMQADGLIDAERATLFIGRAEAMCAAETGASAGPPPLPSQ